MSTILKMKDVNAWHYQYLATNAEEKKQRHASVMAARDCESGLRGGRERGASPVVRYSSTGLLIDGYGRLVLNALAPP